MLLLRSTYPMGSKRRIAAFAVVTLPGLILFGYYTSGLRINTSGMIKKFSSMVGERHSYISKETYVERLGLMHRACQAGFHQQNLALPSAEERIYVSDKYNLGYCNVPKVGSTFWFATFAILDGNVTDTSSPNAVLYKLLEDVQTKVTIKKYGRLSFTARQELSENGHMFLFVRDPYERLLSAYVNKFLSPNAYYWGSFGKQIIKDFRPGASEASRRCGHDVTFPEFLRFIAESSSSDPHWLPIHRMCSPCQYPYNFIGKAETFENDTLELLRRTNLSDVIDYNPVSDQQVSLYMQTKIAQLLEQYPKVKHCARFHDLLERLWQTFQAKGYVQMDEELPQNLATDDIGDDEQLKTRLLDVAFKAYKSTHSDSHVSSFSEKFTEVYYRQVDIALLRKIQQVFWGDFVLFGYHLEPALLFQRKNGLLILFVVLLVIFILAITICRYQHLWATLRVQTRYYV